MPECQVLGNSMLWSLLSGAAASGPRKFDDMVLGNFDIMVGDHLWSRGLQNAVVSETFG